MLKIIRMRQNAIRAVIAISCFLFCAQVWAQADEWDAKKSKHFIVYHQGVPQEYVSKVARRAEHYYKSITDYLGLMRFDFWTWEERCKIYLYPSQKGYLKSFGATPWSRGGVHVIRKEIVSYVEDLEKERFFESTLPHELGHIIFREVVGFDKELPLWIDEGVAVLQEENRRRYLSAARELVEDEQYIHLKQLSKVRSYTQVSPLVLYSEAASIMEFLLERFGRGRFVDFCRLLRDGEDWKEALLSTYKFEDLEALEAAWLDSLK